MAKKPEATTTEPAKPTAPATAPESEKPKLDTAGPVAINAFAKSLGRFRSAPPMVVSKRSFEAAIAAVCDMVSVFRTAVIADANNGRVDVEATCESVESIIRKQVASIDIPKVPKPFDSLLNGDDLCGMALPVLRVSLLAWNAQLTK